MTGGATTLQPESALLELMRGYRMPHALYLAVELGIPDLLAAGPRSVTELAARTGCHAQSLARMLRALASSGVFVEAEPLVFGHTPMSDLLRRDHPETRCPSVLFLGAPYTLATWGALGHAVRTGSSAFRHVHGMTKWEYNHEHPDDGLIFDKVMAGARPSRIAALLENYDFSAAGTVVDVGGGHGQILAAILRRHPSLRGILCDLPTVVAEAKRFLSEASLVDRCQFTGGSFFEKVPTGDTYLLSDILHDWPDQEALQILRTCRAAMASEGRLLVVEYLIVPCETPSNIAWLDLQMLIEFGGGRQRTVEELDQLFRSADLELDRVIPTSDVSIVVARAAGAQTGPADR